MNVTLEVNSIHDGIIWMSDVSDSSSDTMDTAMCGLVSNDVDDSIWGAVASVLRLYAHLGFEPHKTAIGRKPTWDPFKGNLSLSDHIADLVAECDLPDKPPHVDSEGRDCHSMCHGCQLYDRLVDTILDYGLRAGL